MGKILSLGYATLSVEIAFRGVELVTSAKISNAPITVHFF